MEQKKTQRLGMKMALLLFGFVPFITLAVFSFIFSMLQITSKLQADVYKKLEIAATSIIQHYADELSETGDIIYCEDDHDFMQSLQTKEIELTLFKEDTRFISSLNNNDGTYNEGTKALDKVWDTVKKGKIYKQPNIRINNVKYYGTYIPVMSANGEVWGMAFAGEPTANMINVMKSTAVGLLVILVFLIVLFVIIIIILARRISRSLTKAVVDLENLANGDLATEVDNRSNIRDITLMINATANLQKRLKDVIGDAKNTSVELGEAVTEVERLSIDSANGAAQISQAVQELATTSQSMAETVQDTNSKVISMGESIDYISKNAKKSAEDAEEMKKISDLTITMMNNMKKSNESSVDAISRIGVSTEESHVAVERIAVATDIISNIAEETNLLALNASIEAARAGEAGRGFAVVASSIQSLAEESAKSAQEIRTFVEEIITKVTRCVDLTKEASGVMKEQSEFVTQSSQKMDELKGAIDAVTSSMVEITQNADVLDNEKEKILSNVGDLSAISEENAANAQEVSASIESIASAVEHTQLESKKMKELADNLGEQMKYFK